MRIALAVLTVAAATAACGRRPAARPAPATASRPVPSACAAPRGAALDVRAYVVELVTSTDSGSVALREKLRLPALREASQVVFETDPTVCSAAAKALAATQHDTTADSKAAYVLRVGGAGYVAWNYEQVGEFFSYYVFDRNMKLLTAFMS